MIPNDVHKGGASDEINVATYQKNSAKTKPDKHYEDALGSLQKALKSIKECSKEEREALEQDFRQVQEMINKLESGRVVIAVFGEISTGKSALINALIGKSVAQVDIRGGWTKEVWKCAWEGCGYVVPGLASSEVVLVDTPGTNEVDGEMRAKMAYEAAQQADLILFVIDSDLNQREFKALREISDASKHTIVVFNKIDQYTPSQRQRLMGVLCDERLPNLATSVEVTQVAADPAEKEYIIVAPDGRERSECRKPAPDIDDLKVKILEVLEKEGKSLLALNAAMYAADKSDKVAAVRIKLRDDMAERTIWTFVVSKAIAVGAIPIPAIDVISASGLDISMILALSKIYGIQMTTKNVRSLLNRITLEMGALIAVNALTMITSSVFKGVTIGLGTLLVAVPQGGVAGYCSYIIGQTAKQYLEKGASWGKGGPKNIIRNILKSTDRESVIQQLKSEIKSKIIRYNKNKVSRRI